MEFICGVYVYRIPTIKQPDKVTLAQISSSILRIQEKKCNFTMSALIFTY